MGHQSQLVAFAIHGHTTALLLTLCSAAPSLPDLLPSALPPTHPLHPDLLCFCCSSLKAWVIEVNSSPSLSMDTPLDRQVKPRVIRGLLQILDPLPFDREALLSVLEQRVGAKGEGGGGEEG